MGMEKDYTWFYPWALLIISLITGAIVLNTPSSLPVIEQAAKTHVENMITQAILQQTIDKYPTATEQELRSVSREKIQQTLESQEAKELISGLAKTNKEYFEHEGKPYPLGADTYYYLRYAENIIKNGHPGETLKEGKPFDPLRKAPNGLFVEKKILLSFVEAYWFRILGIFSDTTLLKAVFHLPLLLGLFSITMVFLITSAIFKNTTTAFFAATLFAVHPYLFRQNMAGFADTPPLIMTLSLAFFLSLIWIVQGTTRQKILACTTALVSIVMLYYTWTAWYFVFGPVIAFCIGFGALRLFYGQRKERIPAVAAGIIGILLVLALYFMGILNKILRKLQFIERMPGLQETVRELSRPEPQELMQALGDTIFVLILLIAAALMLAKILKNRANHAEIFLLIWLATLFLPATRVLRLALFAAPPATILAAWLLEKIHSVATNFAGDLAPRKAVSLLLLIIIPAAIGATMIDTTKMPLPPMNDAVMRTGEWLKQNTGTEAQITTWWDSGYVWQYAAKRPTLMDAAPNPTTHWVARALLSENESKAIAILRMKNCGVRKSELIARQKLGPKSAEILETALFQTREDAEATLAEHGIPELINLTHCTPPEAYVIVDQNMYDVLLSMDSIGSWDTVLGAIREDVVMNMDEEDAIKYISENLSIENAEQTYYDALNMRIETPDRKLSPVETCTNNTKLGCHGYTVDLENMNATKNKKHPHSLVIYDNGRKEKIYGEGDITLVIYKDEDAYRSVLVSPEYSKTLLIRLFAGDKLDRFTLVHAEAKPKRTMTWKINSDKHEEPGQSSSPP